MDEPVRVFHIEVEAINDPATCDFVIGQRPAIRGLTEWTDKERRTADEMAKVLLDAGTENVEVMENGVHRRYRIPGRVADGWEPVSP